MVRSTKDIGKIIKCMEKEYLNGQMAVSMRVIMLMIRNKEWVRLLGLMEESTKECGSMVCNTVKVNIREKMMYGRRVFGKMVKELNDVSEL